MRPKILCISFSHIESDARVLRQIELLADFGEVTTLGYGPKPVGSDHHLELDAGLPSLPQTPTGVALLGLRLHRLVEFKAPAVRAALKLLERSQFDLVVANEARALPLAHRISRGAPVWGDMHEWAPEERVHVLPWRLLIKPFMTHVCAKYLPLTSAISVVNDSIARLYEAQFRVQTSTVRNSRSFESLEPSAPHPSLVRLVHSGAAVPGRNLEGMVEAIKILGSDYSLDFYLVEARDGGRYLRSVKQLAEGATRVTFHDPVPPSQLPAVLNKYDLGIFSLPPQTRNHELMLPNKFFDFVQARLGIVFSPSPETTRLIAQHRLGAVARDYTATALAEAISGLSRDDVQQFKRNTHEAALELSSRTDEEAQRAILNSLLKVDN